MTPTMRFVAGAQIAIAANLRCDTAYNAHAPVTAPQHTNGQEATATNNAIVAGFRVDPGASNIITENSAGKTLATPSRVTTTDIKARYNFMIGVAE